MRRQRDEIRSLLEALVDMADDAGENLRRAAKAFLEKNPHAVGEIAERDERLDHLENAIDSRCLRITALFQPEADDLRTVFMAAKINNDLERIGDHALNIAERAADLAAHPDCTVFPEFSRIADLARKMVEDSITAFVARDSALAKSVIHSDDEMDALYEQVIQDVLLKDPERDLDREAVIAMVLAAKEFERIADLATNLAEDVIFIVEGVQVRHRPEAIQK